MKFKYRFPDVLPMTSRPLLAPFPSNQSSNLSFSLFSSGFGSKLAAQKWVKNQRLSLSNSTIASRSTHFRWFLCGKSNLGAQWERPRRTPMPNWINNYQKEVEWECTRYRGGHTNQGVRPYTRHFRIGFGDRAVFSTFFQLYRQKYSYVAKITGHF